MRADRWRRATLVLAGAVTLGAPGALAQAPEHHAKTIKQCNDELKASTAALAQAGESPAAFFHDCWWRTATGQATPIHGHANDGRAAGSGAASDRDKARADAELAKAKQEAVAAKREAAAAAAAAKAAQARAAKAEAAMKAETDRAKADTSSAAPSLEPRPSNAQARPDRPPPGKAEQAVSPRRVAQARRRPVAPRRFVVARPFVVPPAERRRLHAAAARPRLAAVAPASPPIVMVPVQIPGLGLKRPIEWPVFPAYVPAFRSVVNHPIVPGFTRTP